MRCRKIGFARHRDPGVFPAGRVTDRNLLLQGVLIGASVLPGLRAGSPAGRMLPGLPAPHHRGTAQSLSRAARRGLEAPSPRTGADNDLAEFGGPGLVVMQHFLTENGLGLQQGGGQRETLVIHQWNADRLNLQSAAHASRQIRRFAREKL